MHTYRVSLRLTDYGKNGHSTEDSRIDKAITAGKGRGVTGDDGAPLSRAHRTRNSDSNIAWRVRGDWATVNAMLVDWVGHKNVEMWEWVEI